MSVSAKNGSVLIVFFSNDLDKTKEKIQKAGGKILHDIFSFPGGRRFHVCDTSDNEFAVWSDK